MDSSSSLQRKHLTKNQPLFWIWSKEKTLLQEGPTQKKSTLEGTHEFQTTHFGNETRLPDSKVAYKYLTENLLLYKFIHTIVLSTSQSFKGHEKQGFQWLSPLSDPKDPPPTPLLKQLWHIKKGKKHMTVHASIYRKSPSHANHHNFFNLSWSPWILLRKF